MISFLKIGQNTAVLYRGLIESHSLHKIRLLIACFSRLLYKQKTASATEESARQY